MAYVRKKQARDKTVYQLVEGYREDGKVKQRVLAHLGECKTVDRALWWWSGRALRMRHVARDLRRDVEYTVESMRKAVRGEAIGGWNDRVVPERAREEAMYRQKVVSRYMDKDGTMRRVKHGPHDLKEMYYRDALGQERSIHDIYLKWNAEYWQAIDYAEQLEREADKLEERYVKLYEINGGDPEEARLLLRNRLQRLLDAYERRSRWFEERRAEKQAYWLKSQGLEDADPIRQMQYALGGTEMKIEETWKQKEFQEQGQS